MRKIVTGVLAWSALALALSHGVAIVRAQSSLGEAEEILILVNQRRAEAGVAPLRLNEALGTAAEAWASDMALAGALRHGGRDGSAPTTRTAAAGYEGLRVGENIARGFSTPNSVMNAWMGSAWHRANILAPEFTDLGVGVATYRGVTYWVQDFGASGRPASAAPAALPPTITAITPHAARIGEDVVITGQRFGDRPGSVTFAGGRAGEIVSWERERVTVTVPDGATSGMVYLQTDAGTSAGVSLYVSTAPGATSSPFTRPAATAPASPAAPPPTSLPAPSPARDAGRRAPSLLRLSASAGSPGDLLLLTGVWFGRPPQSVTFNGMAGTIVRWDENWALVLVPPGASTGPIQLRTDAGASNTLPYTVNRPTATPAPTSRPPAPGPVSLRGRMMPR